MRQVQREITKALQQGKILMTYKTKPQVGRKSVTVGSYRVAIRTPITPAYLLTIGNEDHYHYHAGAAAKAFIDYVGRDDAWNALHGRGRERNPK